MDILSNVRSRSIKLKSIVPTSPLSRSNTADYGSLYWTFDPNNHYLSSKWTKIVFGKLVSRVLILSAIILTIVRATAPTWLDDLVSLALIVLLYIPALTLIILSFNRDARGFIMSSSEFWIKVVYAFMRPVLELILYHNVGRKSASSEAYLCVGYALCCVRVILHTQIMIIVAAMDAIPKMKHKWKLIMSGSPAILYSWWAIDYQLLAPATEDYVFEVNSTGSVFSLHSVLANITGTVAIFLWKQAIDITRKRDRCTSINYSPYLRWETAMNGSGLNASVIQPRTTVLLETEQTDDTVSVSSTQQNPFVVQQ